MTSSSKEWIINVLSDSFVTAWNSKTNELRAIGFLSTPGTFEFLDSLPKYFHMANVKAVVFAILFSDFPNSFQNYNFRLKCREFCQKHATICYIPSVSHTTAFFALSKTQTMVDEGEIVLLVISVGSSPSHLIIKRENGRYKILIEGCSKLKPFSPSWKAEILGSYKPKKIILMNIKEEFLLGPPHDIPKMKKCFKNDNIQIFYPDHMEYNLVTCVDTVLKLMNEKSPTEYDVAISSSCKFEVRVGQKVLIKVSETTVVHSELKFCF